MNGRRDVVTRSDASRHTVKSGSLGFFLEREIKQVDDTFHIVRRDSRQVGLARPYVTTSLRETHEKRGRHAQQIRTLRALPVDRSPGCGGTDGSRNELLFLLCTRSRRSNDNERRLRQ